MHQSVHLNVEPSREMSRVHVAIRLVLLVALATLGCSSLYWVLFLGIPALVALNIEQKGGAMYLAEDAPRVLPGLRWLARAYAYIWLLTDAVPTSEARGAVDLDVEIRGNPTGSSALLRLLYSLPALILLAIMSIVASLLWVVGAISILAIGRVPAVVAEFIAATLRYQFRLIAYHLSIVDSYPSFEEAGTPHALGSA
jgi:uncharacterized protein DUF4389